jgi:sigma-B regulation protein RsbU (phosphoserine phosphatase)
MNSRLLQVRLWLEDKDLFPRGKLAFFALYLLGVDLLLSVIKAISRALHSTYGSSLTGWIIFLTALAAVMLSILGARWASSRLLWKMRTRLVVTYAFIGVIPLVLLIVLAGLAFYLFSGQFATYIVSARLNAQLQSLAAGNTAFARQIALEISQGGTPAAIAPVGTGSPSNPATFAWLGGKLVVSSSRSAAPVLPGYLKQDATETVEDHGQIYLRSVAVLNTSKGPLAVVSSTPVDERLLTELGDSLGEVTLYRSDTGTSNPIPVYSAGNVPPSARTFDLRVQSGTKIPVTSWSTGAPVNPAPVSVITRFSELYEHAFASLGDLASTLEFLLFVLLVALVLFEATAWWVGSRLSGSITRAVGQLYQATTHVNRGDFTHRIPVTSHDQLAALATSFNSMTESLQKLILEQKEKQRLENEITIAQEVQAQLFPRHIAQLPSLEVHGFCRPARSVSGDYYDFLALGRERLLLAVGDVSGKGISAALLMATIHSAVRAYSVEGIPALRQVQAVAAGPVLVSEVDAILQGAEVSPGTLLSLLNHQLYHSTPAEKYATLFLGTYDGEDRRLNFSNAGHLPPLVLAANGNIRRLDCGGTVVGLFDNISYEEGYVQLRPGEIFLAYSDGVTEPENDFGEFGEERLIDLVQENRDLPLARISEIITAAVEDWIGGAEQPDDVTLVLARAR